MQLLIYQTCFLSANLDKFRKMFYINFFTFQINVYNKIISFKFFEQSIADVRNIFIYRRHIIS